MLKFIARRLFFYISAAFLCGCAFVQLSEGGNQVAQVSAPDVANCMDVGEVSAQTRAKVVVRRGQGKVQEELIVLARNQASLLGANAIVPIGEPIGGMQKFRAYKCE